MAGPLEPGVDVPRIIPVNHRQRATDAVRIGRREDEVHMIWHEHPGPDLHTRRCTMPAEQIAIKRVVFVLKKGLRTAIAALRDVCG